MVNPKGPAMLLGVLFLFITSASATPPTDVDIGGLVLSVSDSWTSQVFHIVDQLSEWDQYTHKHYGRWAARNLKLDQEDRQLLQKHAELRRVRGWGHGFEQAFYVDDSIAEAAEKAVSAKLLSADEAAAEKMILLHFAPKLSILRERGTIQIAAFKNRLIAERQKVKHLVQKICRFAETKGIVKVPVFFVTNPAEGDGGGKAIGGRLVVEVQDRPDPLAFLLHEALHKLLEPHTAAIKAAAESAGLKFEVLNEGIAFALAPGLTDNIEERDSLVEALVPNVRRGKPASDNYMQFYMVGLVIRPILRSALDHGETITTFLPKAVDKWRRVTGG